MGGVKIYLLFPFHKENFIRNILRWWLCKIKHLYQSRPDRYVALFGEFSYDPSKWRPSVPFVEQLRAFQELVDEGKVTNLNDSTFALIYVVSCYAGYVVIYTLTGFSD